jgi:hypothetical protein
MVTRLSFTRYFKLAMIISLYLSGEVDSSLQVSGSGEVRMLGNQFVHSIEDIRFLISVVGSLASAPHANNGVRFI